MRILVTRPQPDAQRTAAALRARGHAVIVAPMLRIETMADAEIGDGPWAALLVTSAQAAAAIAAHEMLDTLYQLPVFAVGRNSAQAIRAAGFVDVTAAGGNVGDLARLVGTRAKPGAVFLYLAGEDRSGDLAGDLGARGFTVHTVVIYRAVAAANFPPEVAEALRGGLDAVLHFSRRSAEVFLGAARGDGLLEAALKLSHLCLSAQVAEPLVRAGAGDIRIAQQPAEVAVLDLIGPA